ncbi:MAG: hypothetical protein A2Y41_07920 [Spirochaetes bacterium GWB1_36_13]|nr:MAG: hypothetical protein A2Y41_07920 [Spirochaetes bacterium GWB1_36_13]
MNWKAFITRIIIPTFLAVILFILTIFMIMIPAFEKNILDRKREMIRELTHAGWSILNQYYQAAVHKKMSLEEAQKEALMRIKEMRYGDERKDYFWVNDLYPKMIMHPYLDELNGADLTNYEDAQKKKMFLEMVKVVQEKNEGFVEYMWQWKDNSSMIVPKLSYVKIFQPWNWVIGTGIYIEDVKHEIASITRNLIKISTLIILIIIFILIFLSRQSLKIEREKVRISEALFESKEKYRSLVEASTEGTLMILGKKISYANKTLLKILNYSFDELTALEWNALFSGREISMKKGWEDFNNLLNNNEVPARFEAVLKSKDGMEINFLIMHSPIVLNEKKGFILILKDITIYDQIQNELGKTKEKYLTLINNINIGVFRIEAGGKRKIIEANQFFINWFSISSPEAMNEFQFSNLFFNREEYHSLFSTSLEKGILKNKEVKLIKKDGSMASVLISLVLIKDENQFPLYFDGILEDITLMKIEDFQKENLIKDLQSSLSFLYLPVKNCLKPILSVHYGETIKKTADFMVKNKVEAVLVHDHEKKYIGILSDHDFKERVVGNNKDLSASVYEIMTSPVLSVDENSMVFEVLYLLNEKSIDYIVCRNHDGVYTGILSGVDLILLQQYSSSMIMKKISNAQSVEEIKTIYQKIDLYIKALVETGTNARNVNRILSHISDIITKKIIDFAIEELGNPPVSFAFLALGSEGREEQTLTTDQDNALIYRDLENKEESIEVKKYFDELSSRICDALDNVGYVFCKGNIMAKNPKWCQSVSVWKEYFTDWVYNVSQDNLLEINTFFDFRNVYGSQELVDELKKHQMLLIEKRPNILLFLAQVTSNIKLPINFFGTLSVDTKSKHPDSIDIKLVMLPIVNFARVYALKYGIEENNTIERFEKIYQNKGIQKPMYEEIIQSYDYLMQMRIKNQVYLLAQKKEATNLINPKKLTNIQKSTLEKVLAQIEEMQSKIHSEFVKI